MERLNLNKHKPKDNKPIVYLRQFDFTYLSYYKSKKYGIDRAIYQYIGSSDDTINSRTSKWTYKNINANNTIGKLLRALMKIHRFKSTRQLNKYLLEHTTILKECESIEQARATEKTMISINKWEDANYKPIICLNKRDAEVQISKAGKYILK